MRGTARILGALLEHAVDGVVTGVPRRPVSQIAERAVVDARLVGGRELLALNLAGLIEGLVLRLLVVPFGHRSAVEVVAHAALDAAGFDPPVRRDRGHRLPADDA